MMLLGDVLETVKNDLLMHEYLRQDVANEMTFEQWKIKKGYDHAAHVTKNQ